MLAGGQGIEAYSFSTPFGHILPAVESASKALRFAQRFLRKLRPDRQLGIRKLPLGSFLASWRTGNRTPISWTKTKRPTVRRSAKMSLDLRSSDGRT